MLKDVEYLYLIRQNDEHALKIMMDRFDRLVWSRAHYYYNLHQPRGIVVQDLYQEGCVALHESLFSYEEERDVGLAYYIDLCVTSRIKTELRRCRGYSYRMLDSSFSLDMCVSEDGNLSLGDLVASESLKSNPTKMAKYQEAKQFATNVYNQLTLLEQEIVRYREEGYSYKEIALLSKVQPKKVDNVVQKLRRMIDEYKVIQID